MTVAEMKRWLDQFPDDTIVSVGIQCEAPMWESYGAVRFVELNQLDEISGGWDFISYKGKNYLNLGEFS
jgi:hypothetical protein